MPLVGGADLNGAASGDPTDLRFDRSYRASPTGLLLTALGFIWLESSLSHSKANEVEDLWLNVAHGKI
eukprot:232741-Pleurochrysis_carterae.AAC.1